MGTTRSPWSRSPKSLASCSACVIEDYALAVPTENWPSVEIAYHRLGLRPLFDAFVISSQEGRLKDDPELFAIAAGRMGLPAAAMLSVDDWPPHVQTALGVGFQGAVLDRNAVAPPFPGSPT